MSKINANPVYPSATLEDLLIHAAENGRMDRIGELLEQGAHIDCRGAHMDMTPLMRAISADHEGTAAFLVSKGAALEARDSIGMTALAIAAHIGLADTVRMLADAGADLETRCASGHTPVMLAVEQGNYYSALHLLERGADAAATCPDGSSLVHLAGEELKAPVAAHMERRRLAGLLAGWRMDEGDGDQESLAL